MMRNNCRAHVRLEEDGWVVRSILGLLLILVVVASIPYFVFGKVVPPDSIGVRVNHYGVWRLIDKGYLDNGLSPGLQWQIPMISSVVLLPRDFQIVHLNEGSEKGDFDGPRVDIPTTDGSKVKTDVTLITRFHDSPGQQASISTNAQYNEDELVPVPEKKALPHGGPGLLINYFTMERSNILRKFSETAENELKAELSRLSTTEFYNPVAREKAALMVNDKLNEKVGPVGIEVWGTLIRRYVYDEQKIDDQIFAKNLQDQSEHFNAAKSRLAAAKAETERERALWDAKVRDLEVSGEAKVRVTESEGELYEAKKKAEGDLLVAQARAEVDGAKSNALAQSAGAENYIARELAPLLKTLSGGVVSDLDPYDVEKWIQKFTGEGRARLQ